MPDKPRKEALEAAHAVWESRPANVGWPIGECEKAIAVALDAFAQQAVEVRERELLRKLEALQMRLAPIEEARQQAREAALNGRILGFRIEREGPSPTGLFYVTSPDLPGLLLSETTEIDEMAVRNAIIDLLYVERALKSTASGDGK